MNNTANTLIETSQNDSFVRFSDDDILNALMGQDVMINGKRMTYLLSYQPEQKNYFHVDCYAVDMSLCKYNLMAEIEAQETDLKLIRLY